MATAIGRGLTDVRARGLHRERGRHAARLLPANYAVVESRHERAHTGTPARGEAVAGGRSGEPWTARHAAQRGLGGAGAPGAASGCGGHLGARPALRGRPRRGLARGCPAGPASAPAAHERQRAQRGPGRFFICEMGSIAAPPHESRESGQRPLGRWAVTRATISLCQAELFGLTAEEVYLVHDELDKPLGKVAVKLGGSARGHNGVRSCISCLNSHAMPRLRIGIGRPAHPDTVQAHVLGSFSAAEQELLPLLLERATDMLLDHIRERSQRPSLGPDLSEFLPP
ncbi:probable peptidyl-tRNA hydrolase isoform X1 [Felis catus]|uniref:probable peptidyl-tRNA hydrolase isoform X1 n=1 Tax=Felis catus TaxID=9685 RepID=UPI001D19AC13|nr:probable peptidyl-tRNA hydrolase isoform X1 [Felis catus]